MAALTAPVTPPRSASVHHANASIVVGDNGSTPPSWDRDYQGARHHHRTDSSSNLCDAPHPPRSPLTPRKAGQQSQHHDRFIPNRNATCNATNLHSLLSEPSAGTCKGNNTNIAHPGSENSFNENRPSTPSVEYQKCLSRSILHGDNEKILMFKQPKPLSNMLLSPSNWCASNMQLQEAGSAHPTSRKPASRPLPKSPFRVLDAPNISDDYYLNLVSWSATNIVAVGLDTSVYTWNANTGLVKELMNADGNDYICSVSWAVDGRHLAIGLSSGNIEIWDATVGFRKVRSLSSHILRVSTLAWSSSNVLVSGGKDATICHHDVRVREDVTGTMHGHDLEICGMSWSSSGMMLASGGNDNLLHIWDVRALSRMGDTPLLHKFTDHRAAVKALAWCPFQSNMLASGGGSNDRSIKFWNAQTGAMLSSVTTCSQVSALQWNTTGPRELVSSHGYSKNHICLWKYPNMTKVTELYGHHSRVLHLAQSPDGSTLLSAAGDETMRFWSIFGEPSAPSTAKSRIPSSIRGSSVKAIHLR